MTNRVSIVKSDELARLDLEGKLAQVGDRFDVMKVGWRYIPLPLIGDPRKRVLRHVSKHAKTYGVRIAVIDYWEHEKNVVATGVDGYLARGYFARLV